MAGAAGADVEHGVSGMSLNDVRSAVGVSGSQLAHYFADKRHLTRQVIAARTDDVIAFHTQSQLGALDSFRALRAWADACVAQAQTVYLRGGCIYGSLTGELLEADGDVLDDLAAGYGQWLKLFRDGVAAMRRSGELTSDADPRHLAVAFGRCASGRHHAHVRDGKRRTHSRHDNRRGRLRWLVPAGAQEAHTQICFTTQPQALTANSALHRSTLPVPWTFL